MFRRRQRGASPRVTQVPGQWKASWGPRLRWAGVAIVLALFGAGFYQGGLWLLDPAQFPLRHVRIYGELRNLNQTDIEETVKGYLGQNFFALNIDALHAGFEANPWIDRVSVRRLWPDTLEVRIQERSAFGYWGRDEMVDVNGKRFQPHVLRQPGSWPQLAGPDGHEMNLIRVWKEADALLNKAGLKLVHLMLDQRRAWSMQCANGIQISLGREDFAQRLQRLVDIYPRVLAGQSDRIALIDMRYTNGFAVRWTNPPETGLHAHRVSKSAKPAKMISPQVAVLTNLAG